MKKTPNDEASKGWRREVTEGGPWGIKDGRPNGHGKEESTGKRQTNKTKQKQIKCKTKSAHTGGNQRPNCLLSTSSVPRYIVSPLLYLCSSEEVKWLMHVDRCIALLRGLVVIRPSRFQACEGPAVAVRTAHIAVDTGTATVITTRCALSNREHVWLRRGGRRR